MLELDRIHKPRKPTDVRDKKQAPVLHGCCPHVRHTSNVYVEGLPALPSALHYSIFPMPPDVVGDPWTADGESASRRHALFRQGGQMMVRRQISEDIT